MHWTLEDVWSLPVSYYVSLCEMVASDAKKQ
jgi:hypothetical protein